MTQTELLNLRAQPHLTKGHENIVEAGETKSAVSIPTASFQPPPVVSDVDVGEVINEFDKAGGRQCTADRRPSPPAQR